jgi:hypothetical protein
MANLLVAWPGKASLAFRLGEAAATRVQAQVAVAQ